MRAVVTAVLVALLGLAGCTPAVPPAPAPSPSSTQNPASAADDREAYLKERALLRGVANPPDVALIREVTPEEEEAVLAQCMTAAGFPPNEGTLNEWDVAEGQGDALVLALYTCDAQYPLAWKYRKPRNQDQITIIYQYYGGELTQCLKGLGYDVPPLPTLEEFLATAGTKDEYNPYALVPDLAPPEDEKKCPQFPYDKLYPE